MSGRSGYRKTSAKRPSRKRSPSEISLSFTLPHSLSAFVPVGAHGIGVTVETFGYVRITGIDRAIIYARTHEFLASIAKDHPPLCLSAVLIRQPSPSNASGACPPASAEKHQISVASGRPVVTIARTKADMSTTAR